MLYVKIVITKRIYLALLRWGNSDFSELKIAVVYLNMLKKIDL